MKILVVGSGGREHALVWRLKNSPAAEKIYCCPGSAGIAEDAVCIPVKATDFRGIIAASKDHAIDLIVIGPEQPLVDGLADRCNEEGIPVFGPVCAGARLEGSKVFAKEFMAKYGIPTPAFRVFSASDSSIAEAMRYLRENAGARVVKADGLCAGKGVIVCSTLEEAENAVHKIAIQKEFGEAGKNFIIEERHSGQEVSILVLTDGQRIIPLIASQDHKQIFANDEGPNTGGMGAYAPVPFITREKYNEIIQAIWSPLLNGLRQEKIDYRGIIYAGLMLTDNGIFVLEFNCRFGDPETQPILCLLKSDFADLLGKCAAGNLGGAELEWESGYAACVVIASGGYPGAYEKGKPILGIEEAEKLPGVKVFHAGTDNKDGKLVTNGGRVLGVTAKGPDLKSAITQAYRAVNCISFENYYFRPDIGYRVL